MPLETKIWNLYENIKLSFSEQEESASEQRCPSVSKSQSGKIVSKSQSGTGCTNCGSLYLISKEGIVACKDCGVNNGSIIEYGSEWRYYGGNDNRYKSNPNRCGGVINPLLQQTSYRTFIQGKGSEYFRKCHLWNNSIYKETRLMEMFRYIDSFVSFNKIPKNIAHITNGVYYKVYPHKLIRGKNVDCQIINIIYHVAKACGVYYTNKEMIKMMNEYNDAVGSKKYKKLVNKDFSHGGKLFLRSYFMNDSKNLRHIYPTTVDQYIEKYCQMLKLPQLEEEAKRIAKFLRVYGITNDHTYISVAISAIYYVIQQTEGLKCTKVDMVNTCKNVSASTVSKVCKSIIKYQSLFLKKS